MGVAYDDGLGTGVGRPRRRRWHLVGLVVAVASGALAAVTSPATGTPAPASVEADRQDPVSGSASPTGRVVTLITGDRVEVTPVVGGRTVLRLLEGSPHFREPGRMLELEGDHYVIPGADLDRWLDPSMFNVDRLARLTSQDGTVPVRVRFEPGTEPHDVRGVDVAPRTARTTASGASIVRGSYSTEAPGILANRSRQDWQDVAQVSLPGPDPSDAEKVDAADYELRTLTVEVRDRTGHVPEDAAVAVMNESDSRLFTAYGYPVRGKLRLSVPEGHYTLLASDYDPNRASFVVRSDVTVEADRTVTLTAAEATARAGSTVPGAREQITYLNIERAPEVGFEIGESPFPAPGYEFYVSPTPRPRLGSLLAVVSADLVVRHENAPATPVRTVDWSNRVPDDLVYEHTRSDFATVRSAYRSDGNARSSRWYSFGLAPGQGGTWVWDHAFRVPSQRRELYQVDRKVEWYASAEVPGTLNDLIDTTFPGFDAGEVREQEWFRGPLHPGVGVPVRTPPTGVACPACRRGDIMRFRMPPFTDASPTHAGFKFWGKQGSWSLSLGRKVLADGPVGNTEWRGARVDVPAREARYRLATEVRMPSPLWRRGEATWGFVSGTSDRVLPLLVPRYRLPVDMWNRLPAGRTSFQLAIPKLGHDSVHIVKPAVKVSYNGGKTWKRAKVIRNGPEVFRVRVNNPRPSDKPRYGSIQVRAKDRAGSTVRETVMRAWQIRGGGREVDASGDTGTTPSADGVPRHACGNVGERQFRCLAVVGAYGARALDARADPAGYGAHELRDAYNLPAGVGAGQTVAVVVAFDYPTAAKDLNVYREQYGLPPCTVASGCFTKLNQDGIEGDYPRKDQGWALEAALDVQMASAACPRCNLVLVEANSPFLGPITKAVDTAAARADVVSHSYGAYEFTGVKKFARHYDVDGVAMTVSSGDFGYEPASFPSSAPSVISVGGTALRHADNDRGWRERVWRGGVSGCSAYFAKPDWQTDTACHLRTAADVAAVADPKTGLAVYDSFGYAGVKGWFVLGGTSAGAPLVAGMIAAAGDSDTFTGADLYTHADALHDVVKGTNGYCQDNYMCTAKPDYDAPTGLGTPNGLDAFTDTVP